MQNTTTFEAPEIASRRRIKRNKSLKKRHRSLKILAIILIFVVLSLIFAIFSRLNDSGLNSYYENQIDAAQRVINKTSNPRSLSMAYAKIGYIYYQVDRKPRALINFKRALTYTPKSAIVLYWLGRTAEDQGSVGEAVNYYTKAADYAIKTRKFLPYYELGRVYQQKKDFNKAIEYYKKSTSDDNEKWNTHYKLGEVYEKINQKKLALDEYRIALKYYPSNKEASEGIKRLTSGQKQGAR